MPGSVTITHQGHAAAVGPDDADRLITVLAELIRLLDATGPDRLSDAQVGVLGGGGAPERADLGNWLRHVTADLSGQMHHGLGHA